MSAEISHEIELYTGPPLNVDALRYANIPEESSDDTIPIEIPLHPDVPESVTLITQPEGKCFPDCPIIKHGISEIMDESDKAVVQSLVRWINNVHDACSAGPQKTTRPRFFIVGTEIEEITCGSHLSKHHPKQRTSRNQL